MSSNPVEPPHYDFPSYGPVRGSTAFVISEQAVASHRAGSILALLTASL